MRYGLKIKLDNVKFVSFLCLAILFITSWAGFLPGNPLGTDTLRIILNYMLWVFIGISFLAEGLKKKRFNLFELTTIIAILIYRAFNIFYAYDYKGLGLTSIAIGIFFCYQSDEIRAKTFKYFKYIMVAESCIGIVCFILYFLPIGFPYTIVQKADGSYWVNFRLCYFMTSYNSTLRFTGLFDEPGWFGTWAAFFLCADNINFKKKENILLLVAGMLTFSLAFVMLIIIYYALKNFTDFKRWLWLVALILLYVYVLPNISTGNIAIDNLLKRMVITSDGLSGDNRSGSLFKKIYEQTIHSNKIYLGYGAGYAEIYGVGEGEGLASIKSYIVNFGIVGTLIIFVPIFIASLRQSLKLKNKLMMFYIIITFASLYQRPYLFWNPYFIIFICGMSYISYEDAARFAGTVQPQKLQT